MVSPLDQLIEPGERVVWRTGSLREEFYVAVKFAIFLFVVSVASAYWLTEGLPILFTAVVVLIYFVRWTRRPCEAWLTSGRILFQRGFLRPAITVFGRPDVVRLEIFENDDTLVLHGRDAELFRASLVDAPDGLAEELNLPITVWRDRVPPYLLGFTILAVVLVPLFGLLFLVAAFIGAIAILGVDPVSSAGRDLLEYGGPLGGLVAVAAVLAVLAFGNIAGLFSIALLRRLWLTTHEMKNLRCALRDPLWAGNDPRSPLYSNRLYRIYRLFRLTLDRAFYGSVPDCGAIEPELLQPGEWERD